MAWAEHGPENFANRAALVGAEIARIEGRELDAERLYEQAIRSARANRLRAQRSARQRAGGALLRRTRLRDYCRMRICARPVTAISAGALMARSGSSSTLSAPEDGRGRRCSDGHDRGAGRPPGPGDRDQSVPSRVGQIVLEKLLDMLMRTALAQAGAERGLLLLPPWRRAAPRGGSHNPRRHRQRASDRPVHGRGGAARGDCPLCHAYAGQRAARRCRSPQRVCRGCLPRRAARPVHPLVPLLNQARLTGVLYLENTLTPHVFTPTRSAVLTLLASQAAISLENARLYAERQRAEEAVRQAQAELAHAARLTTLGELTASIAHEINQPLGAMVNSANACLRWLGAQNLERAGSPPCGSWPTASARRPPSPGSRPGPERPRPPGLARPQRHDPGRPRPGAQRSAPPRGYRRDAPRRRRAADSGRIASSCNKCCSICS